MFDGSYIDPFTLSNPPRQLTNFATGMSANEAVEKSLLSALEKGEALSQKFVNERLIPEEDGSPQHKTMYSVMPRSGVITMANMKKSVTVKGKQIDMEGEMIYMRFLAMNSKTKVPHERVMSYENSSVPLSMFKTDGTMNGSEAKSDFLHKLEGLLPDRKQTTLRGGCDAIIFDGNALINVLPAPTMPAQLESSFNKV